MPANQRKRFRVDDLFVDTRPQASGVEDLVNAKEIRIDRIERDPNQPRTTFNEESLAELAASIAAEGVLQPIAVRYDTEMDRYIIIHGERRWRAAAMAGLDRLPAIVREIDDDRILLQQLMENIVREDLNPLDRAAALRELKDQMNGAAWERVAEAVGIRRSRLFQLIGTEKLAPSLQEALRTGLLSERQTRAAQQLGQEEQEELGKWVMDGGVHSSMVSKVARQMATGLSVQEALAAVTPDTNKPVKGSPTSVSPAQVREQIRGLHRLLDGFAPGQEEAVYEELAALMERIEGLIGDLR